MAFWDGLIGALFSARTKARAPARMSYDAARRSYRNADWRVVTTDAAGATEGQIVPLRAQARDMRRNNPHAARIIQAIGANVVGTGIEVTVQHPDEARRDAANTLLREHIHTPAIDADGVLDLLGLQRLIAEAVAESGEVLIRRRWRREADGLKLPLQIQVLEADYLDHSKTVSLPNGNQVIQGIEFDLIGRRVAYWLHQGHPGTRGWRAASWDVKRVPASEIAHVYRMDRPGQVRGVTWLAPVMLRLDDLARYQEAELVRQKVAAMFAMFVHDQPGMDPADVGPVAGETEDGHPIEEVAPGAIEYLPNGKTLSFTSPPATAETEFVKRNLQAIAAGIGITAESLTFNMTDVNFSSGRMGWQEMARNVNAWRWQMMIPQACEPIGRWLLEAMAFRMPTDGMTLVHTPPRREMVDPSTEIPALVSEVRAGFRSWQSIIREYGEVPDRVLDELSADTAAFDARGLVLDVDARRVSAAGLTQARPTSSQNYPDPANQPPLAPAAAGRPESTPNA